MNENGDPKDNRFKANDVVVSLEDVGWAGIIAGNRYCVDGPYGSKHIYLVGRPGPLRSERFKLDQSVPEDAFQVPPAVSSKVVDVPADLPKLEAAVEANAQAADPVNLPNHYARFKIEPIRFLVENFGPVILVGKVVKYTMRYDAKNGLEDLRKAKRCLEMLIKHTEGDPDWWKREAK